MSRSYSRRAFLRVSTLVTLGGAGSAQLLSAACSPNSAPSAPSAPAAAGPTMAAAGSAATAPTVAPAAAPAAPPTVATTNTQTAAGSSTSGGGRVQLPTLVPISASKPDFPGTETVPDGYIAYPKSPFQSVAEKPTSSGGDVNWMTYTQYASAALQDNPAWQAVNAAVGANLKLTLTPFADYTARLQTTLAGNDLPDIVFMQGFIADQAQLLKTRFADLTPYLSGDAVKEYPNLAALPSVAWKNCLFNGGIYAVPTAYMRFFWMLWARQDMLQQIGSDLPSTADEFKRILVELTRPQDGVWGIASHVNASFDVYTGSGGMYPAMFGAPNQWRQFGGKFTRTWETEQFRAGLGFARDLFAAGVYHPDSLNYNTILVKRQNFEAGKFAFEYDGMTVDLWNLSKQLNPNAKLRQPVPPPSGGSTGHYWFGSGAFGISAIKQSSPERIKQILRIVNYIAAPFGSQEYLLLHYGVQGTDYDLDPNGNPQLSTKGQADLLPWGGGTQAVPNPPQVLYNPTDPQFVSVIQNDQKAMAAVGLEDPTVGLFSRTNSGKGAVLNQAMLDGLTDIVKGAQPLSAFDQLVNAWRTNGGDQIRTEYEEAYAAANV